VGAKAMEVSHLFGKFSLSQNCLIIRPRSSAFNIRFSYFGFQSLFAYERLMIPDHMQPSFRMEDFYQYRLPCPPIEEQRAIASHVESRLERMELLEAKAHEAQDLLQERRTALISAAVTGKIDVRGWKPPSSTANSETEMDVA